MAAGVDIEGKDYQSTILSSLPISLANFASAQLAAAQMYSPTKTLDPDVLISLIGEKFDCQKIQHSCHYSGKPKDETTTKAMAVNPSSSKGKGGKGGARKLRGVCWNYGETGHFKDKCPKPKVNKMKDSSTKKYKASSSANTATKHKSDSESEGAFTAVDPDDETALSDDGSMPDLEAVLESSSEYSDMEESSSFEENWFPNVGDDANKLDNEA